MSEPRYGPDGEQERELETLFTGSDVSPQEEEQDEAQREAEQEIQDVIHNKCNIHIRTLTAKYERLEKAVRWVIERNEPTPINPHCIACGHRQRVLSKALAEEE